MEKRIRPEIKHRGMEEDDIAHFEGRLDKLLNSFQERPENLARFDRATEVAITADALGEPDELSIQYLQLALSLGVAHFVSALALPVTYELEYLGQHYPYAIGRTNYSTDPTSWLSVFSLALILRDHQALAILCQVSTDAMRQAETETDEAAYSYVDFLKGLLDPDSDIGELLFNALDATSGPDISAARDRYLTYNQVPLLSLYRCFLSDDEAEFKEKLQEALELHKTYWADDPMERAGWISLELVALLSLVHDNKDWRLDIESDYIPAWLCSGQYVL
ncbi:immunity 49 family protein [Gallaecimonas kandeliae]|uniref:immunity 49 family protein n=1 Tax=Gallaecimonas kandeliae TaxID=3029055 RepID=UPI002649094F|nr:immunity 49 family protein [Gallaecimonas kandeliae]WKE65754.1 immunity 49 family protein [Gallaecimonas kandeliae]